jgi:FlaA1/EpsC-like NDP-sugar epimerase
MAEYGETFVLDMGEPVRIVDLVQRFADHLHVPDVQIRYTGLRPGEKLHESLFSEHEERLPTIDPGIWATRPTRLPEDFAGRIEKLYLTSTEGDDDEVRRMLAELMPNYTPAVADEAELAAAAKTRYLDEF